MVDMFAKHKNPCVKHAQFMIYVSLSAKGIKSSISSLVVYRNVAEKLLDKPCQSFIMRLKVFIYLNLYRLNDKSITGLASYF